MVIFEMLFIIDEDSSRDLRGMKTTQDTLFDGSFRKSNFINFLLLTLAIRLPIQGKYVCCGYVEQLCFVSNGTLIVKCFD